MAFGLHDFILLKVTALMGAHSLGKATFKSTGYRHSWTPRRENIFSNEFYQLLHKNASMYCNEVRLLNNLIIKNYYFTKLTDLKYKIQEALKYILESKKTNKG